MRRVQYIFRSQKNGSTSNNARETKGVNTTVYVEQIKSELGVLTPLSLELRRYHVAKSTPVLCVPNRSTLQAWSVCWSCEKILLNYFTSEKNNVHLCKNKLRKVCFLLWNSWFILSNCTLTSYRRSNSFNFTLW